MTRKMKKRWTKTRRWIFIHKLAVEEEMDEYVAFSSAAAIF